MDRLKIQILHLLEEDSTLQKETIAHLLGAPLEDVKRAIAELEESKVILRYSTIINWEKAEGNKVTAMIEVKVTPQRDSGFDALAERIYRFPEVRALYLMSGAYDFSLVVEGNSIKEVARFVSEKLSTIEHVISTTTHFILKTYKEEGVIFEDHEGDQRLVVSP